MAGDTSCASWTNWVRQWKRLMLVRGWGAGSRGAWGSRGARADEMKL